MKVRVLVVDDSAFFVKQIERLFSKYPSIQVVGHAENGREAVETAVKVKPDVITMDHEMPVMDGLSAVKKIMRLKPTAILMFSHHTPNGAQLALDALEAGAMDYLLKESDHLESYSSNQERLLIEKVKELGAMAQNPLFLKRTQQSQQTLKLVPSGTIRKKTLVGESSDEDPNEKRLSRKIKLIVIGTSTGGPLALESIFKELSSTVRVPIVVAQHMPAQFTPVFAQRLNELTPINVRTAKATDLLSARQALFVPGGEQIAFDANRQKTRLYKDKSQNYSPSVDLTFSSAASAFGDGVLGIVLTGMGNDGLVGARVVKDHQGVIWSQDQASSLIFGMPGAVSKHRLTDKVLGLQQITQKLNALFG